MTYEIFGKEDCRYCTQAKELLDAKGINYNYIDITHNVGIQNKMKDNGLRSVPQIWKDGFHIGGYTELVTVVMRGEN